ncbi:uncharacterized protein ACA1_066570 [Acanthamoeba castellanii str. Neff]|uniref:Uncharacterized protein n=1 Tax=Acanthamoeba castellanii (strain ATCC 30010 / Neff) TaxID=1257118 RepID=L8GR85_ACACF|nr:uncharacterized protein ACA1_066570 [Acanthamoeba castellanii str. Neff]ELR14626.1 hypothetical protein ACA1_066570 [Acanthamoeba castellanii str. Neff]
MEKQEQAPHLDEEQRKLLLSLLNSGPEAAAKTLKSKLTASPGSATGLLDAFVQFLFSASDSIKTETALVYCLWLACGGTNPNAVIQKIKSNSAGKSNAAICVDCFRAGNHEGHDFSLIHVGGGCWYQKHALSMSRTQ